MKSSLIRPALAALLVAGLSACGGSDKDEFVVGGTISGVVYPGIVLITNGMEINVAPPATAGADVTFAFPKKLEYGDVYNVQFKGFPAHQSCGMLSANDESNNDTAGRLSTINIQFACYVNNYAIGGNITGLKAAGLQLANGSTGGSIEISKPTEGSTDAIAYVLPNVNYGITYGVSIIAQPAGQHCTINNATGTMGDAEVDNIHISCVDL